MIAKRKQTPTLNLSSTVHKPETSPQFLETGHWRKRIGGDWTKEGTVDDEGSPF